jgi:hypothetical protein
MASIAEVRVEILPSTAKVADGRKKALLGADDDVRGEPAANVRTERAKAHHPAGGMVVGG